MGELLTLAAIWSLSMSYHQAQHQPDSAIPAMIGIGAIVIVVIALAAVKKVADALGADFWVVFYALLHMVIGLVVFGGAVFGAAYLGMLHNLRWTIGLFLAGTGSVVWWCFATVFDSMALGGQNPASETVFHYGDFPFWDSWWFQWGGTVLLLVCVVVAGWRAWNDN
jgi:hypothetical protein